MKFISNFLKENTCFRAFVSSYADWLNVYSQRGGRNATLVGISIYGSLRRTPISESMLNRCVFGFLPVTSDLRLREINEPVGTHDAGAKRTARTARNDQD